VANRPSSFLHINIKPIKMNTTQQKPMGNFARFGCQCIFVLGYPVIYAACWGLIRYIEGPVPMKTAGEVMRDAQQRLFRKRASEHAAVKAWYDNAVHDSGDGV
jgi:hypothetical protein